MEKNILSKNKFLKEIFDNSEKLTPPITISQISFAKKTIIEDHILFIGDAAGMITPLCGNGMSMALHSAKLVEPMIQLFLSDKISRAELESNYKKIWEKEFGRRIATGRTVQKFFGKVWQTNLFVKTMKLFPAVTNFVIKQTHGKEF